MFNRRRDDPRQAMRTVACVREMHAQCPHMVGGGGGFDLDRLRHEFGVGLCSCDCHASCPVSGEKRLAAWLPIVPARTWLKSCTCPGAEAERARWEEAGFEPADLAEVQAQHAQRSRARRAAFEAARARSAGKSREEIRDLYATELRARGQEIPAPELLDANVAAMTGNPFPTVRLVGRSLFDTVKFFRETHRPRELTR